MQEELFDSVLANFRGIQNSGYSFPGKAFRNVLPPQTPSNMHLFPIIVDRFLRPNFFGVEIF